MNTTTILCYYTANASDRVDDILYALRAVNDGRCDDEMQAAAERLGATLEGELDADNMPLRGVLSTGLINDAETELLAAYVARRGY